MQILLPLSVLLSSVGNQTLERLAPATGQRLLVQVIRDQQLGLRPACQSSLINLLFSDFLGKEWAKRMTESLSHRPPDLRSSRLADFGDFDSCIGIQEPRIQGKYCLYRQHFDLTSPATSDLLRHKPPGFSLFFRLETLAGSLCLPASCSDQEVLRITQKYLVLPGTRAEIRSGCETLERIWDPELAKEEWVFQVILLVWVSFVVLATTLAPTLDSKVLRCFSLTENAARVLSSGSGSSSSSDRRDFAFLYFYRFLFLVVAAMMHVFQIQIFWSPLAVINVANYRSSHAWLLKMMAAHPSHSMGSNLVWAGFLGFWGRVRELERSGRFDLVKGFANRVARTIPTIVGCYLTILAFPRSLASGPVARDSVSLIRSNCFRSFWRELTFTQNLETPIHSALTPTWILAADLQLFAASFLLIFLYFKRPRLGKQVIAVAILAACVAQGIYVHANQYPGFLSFASYDLRSIVDRTWRLHVSTINYVSSYLMGMLAAIALREKLNLRPGRRVLATSYFFLAYFGTFAWPYTWSWRHVSRAEELVYAATFRTLVASSIAASVFRHATRKDCLYRAFTARVFQTLGRFSFSIYMAHFLFLYFHVFTVRRPIDYHDYSFLLRTSCVVLNGCLLGLLIHLLFEAPFIQFARLLFSSSSSSSSSLKTRDPLPLLSSTGDSRVKRD